MSKIEKAATPASYEEAIQRLRTIVAELENGTARLDDTVSLYEEGLKLSAFCNACLSKAEQKIITLENPQQ